MSVVSIMSHPKKLSVRFKLVAERTRLAEERKKIRFDLTMAIIEEILRNEKP